MRAGTQEARLRAGRALLEDQEGGGYRVSNEAVVVSKPSGSLMPIAEDLVPEAASWRDGGYFCWKQFVNGSGVAGAYALKKRLRQLTLRALSAGTTAASSQYK